MNELNITALHNEYSEEALKEIERDNVFNDVMTRNSKEELAEMYIFALTKNAQLSNANMKTKSENAKLKEFLSELAKPTERGYKTVESYLARKLLKELDE